MTDSSKTMLEWMKKQAEAGPPFPGEDAACSFTPATHLYCTFGSSDGKLVPRSDLNRTLTMPDGRPMILSERAVDDAVAARELMRDGRPMSDMLAFRRARARVIEEYFLQCAQHVIDKLEEREEWTKFGMGRK